MLVNFQSKLLNKVKKQPLEIRILIIAGVSGLLFSVLASISNYLLDLGALMILVPVGTAVMSVVMLYLALIKGEYKFPAYFSILTVTLVMYPLIWLINGGSHGPMVLFMLFNAVFCAVLLTRLKYKVILIAQLLILYGLLAFEYFYPNSISGYNNEITRLIDIGFSFTLVFCLAFYMVVRIMREYNDNIIELETVKIELMKANKKLSEVSETDDLTGIYNRRHIMRVLSGRLMMNKPDVISLIMFDIDHFKRINDTFGHNVGDEVLKRISCTLMKNIRKTDTLARIGGEEFLVFLPNSSVDHAFEKAEKIRLEIESLAWEYDGLKVTLSGGIYCQEQKETLDELLENVDRKLYLSKKEGRNKISY